MSILSSLQPVSIPAEDEALRHEVPSAAKTADRLGIPEAKSFATLIQQSEELGSSLVDSLRVYSDEMRAKRYARAEEKAHAERMVDLIIEGLSSPAHATMLFGVV